MKKTVLVLCDHYVPGYKAGGPIRTISNIVLRLSDHIDFRIITGDRDLGDKKPYPAIAVDAWTQEEHAEILYLPPGLRSMVKLCKFLMTSCYDVLYLNSLFSRKFSILPVVLFWMNKIHCQRVILAPRGSCAASAMRLKRLKKSLFLMIAKALGFYKSIIWHASSKHEAADIVNVFGYGINVSTVSSPVVIVPDMTPLIKGNFMATKHKLPGALRIIFIGRIAKMKNLDYALSLLQDLKGDVFFDIYGPSEDKQYWADCMKQINTFPHNIKVSYCGVIEHEKVLDVFNNYHVLLLPTLGENFGHVILEALSSGCPVIISNRTPWRNLESEGVGWDIPLERDDLYRGVLQRCVDMNQADYDALSVQSRAFSKNIINDNKIIQKHIDLFCSGTR